MSPTRILITLALSFVITACSTDDSPDLVIFNGTLLTMDSETQGATAFAVDDGLIIAVGSDEEILQLSTRSTEQIDLDGNTLLPGFNDAHLHALALPAGSVPIGDVRDRETLHAILRERATQLEPDQWVVAHGYDDTNFGGHLTYHDLDASGVGNPILLIHGSLHLYLINGVALSNAGINNDTPDPAGGFYGRDAAGKLNGLVSERSALEPVFVDSQPAPYPIEFSSALTALNSFMATALANGITSYSDAMVPPELAYLYWWVDPEAYGVRVNLMFDEAKLDDAITLKQRDEALGEWGWNPFSNPWLRGRTVKLFHGMSLSGRTARLHEEYADRPGYFGEAPQRNQAELDAFIRRVHDAGFQAATHSNGDYEIDMVLNAYEKVIDPSTDIENPRHRIEHGSIASQSILERMSKLGVVYAPHSYMYEKGNMLEAYGEARWPWLFPNAASLEHGIVNAANSDYPVSALSPLRRIQSLMNRTSRSGKTYGKSQVLSAEQALYAYTMGGAYASFEENVKGSITAGKYADFVILAEDPRAVAIEKIHAIDILATYSAGIQRYRK